MKSVYLAGPISGLSYGDTVNWRDAVTAELKEYCVKGLSPMRGKAFLGKATKIADHYKEEEYFDVSGTIAAINIRDHNDVYTCDALLVNLLGATTVSIGTVMEIAWARAYKKPVVLVMEKEGNIHEHAMLTYDVIRVDSLEEGIKQVTQILAREKFSSPLT